MDLSRYVTQLREDLASAAAAGDEQTQRTGALLGAAIEPAARLALMNALADLAAEVTEALGDRVVEVRLDGRDVRVAVSAPDDNRADEPERESADSPFAGFGPRGFAGFGGLGGEAGDISRVTLRLVEQIKNQAEQAAANQGMSLNSWVAQAVQGALAGHQHGKSGRRDGREGRDGKDGKRVKGWVQG
jgi:DNA-binding transcriptional LysR family regulator